jgi:hypothetical protein
MNSKRLKLMLAAAVAVLAVSAAASTAASAGTFKAGSYPATITGTQATQVIFTGVVGTWKCGALAMQGELKEESTSLNLTPLYSECSWAGVAATINMEGCTYNYTAGNTLGENKIEATMDVVCPAGKEAKLTLTNGCTIRIPSQNGLKSVTAENTLMDVDLQLGVTAMTYTVENGTKCPNTPANGTYTNGTLSGVETLIAENSKGEQISFAIS